MSDHFRRIVRDEIASGLMQHVLPVQGVATSIDMQAWHCHVRIPLPHGGVQQGAFATDGSYVVLEAVPMPRTPSGLIDAGASMLLNALGMTQTPAVLVGFKGGNLQFPFVICFLDVIPQADTTLKTDTENRQAILTNTLASMKGAKLPPPAVTALPFGLGISMVANTALQTALHYEEAKKKLAASEAGKDAPAAAVQKGLEEGKKAVEGAKKVWDAAVNGFQLGIGITNQVRKLELPFGIKLPGFK